MAEILRFKGHDSQGNLITKLVPVATGTLITPGNSIQSALNGNTGMVYVGPGKHRLTSKLQVTAQGRSLFLCEGAEILGSRAVANWTTDGAGRWSAAGHLPAAYSGEGTCTVISGAEANPCRLRESLYADGVQLKRRMVLADLQPGEYHADYAANKVYVRDNPALYQWELSRTDHLLKSTAADFKLLGDGGVVRGFASPAQQGALVISGSGWEVSGVEFRGNHGSGIHLTGGHGAWVHDVRLIRNEQMGWTHHASNNTLFERMWVESNNPVEEFYPLDWESGGTKYSSSSNCTVDDSDFVSNHGINFWLDIDWEGITLKRSRLQSAGSCNVRAEIGFGAVIEDCTMDGSGEAHARIPNRNGVLDTGPFATAGIMVNCSQNVTVRRNTVRGSLTPMELVQRNRSPQYSTKPGWETRQRAIRNCRVEDNDFTVPVGGYTGVGQLDSAWTTIDPYYGKSWGNTAARNKYRVPSSSAAVFHMYETGRNQMRSFAKWQQLMEPTATMQVS